jgi:hypothetical protein
MADNETPPYEVACENGICRVVDTAGQVVCVCGDQTNAESYLVLLNQAYKRGYKAGYREAKSH